MGITFDRMYANLKSKLRDTVADEELRLKVEMAVEINRLKEERNALILVHNYIEPSLYYSIADYVGDSLELSRRAASADKDVIVFCGVKFMAETAKILNPTRTVLLPAPKAGCSLADSITAEDVRNLKRMFPGVPVVTYVNTYADVKAESDICCTSGNAVSVVKSLGSQRVIFLPDEYLARNIAQQTGKRIIFPTVGSESAPDDNEADYQMIGWRGRCEVHEQFTPEDIREVRHQHPEVAVLTHPECSPEVAAASDFVGSTSAMVKYVERTQAPYYLILTESAMGDNIAAAYPEKNILRLRCIRCPHMEQTTMEGVLDALQNNRYIIEVPEEIRIRAFKAVERMIAIG